jgi:hypothetical protein
MLVQIFSLNLVHMCDCVSAWDPLAQGLRAWILALKDPFLQLGLGLGPGFTLESELEVNISYLLEACGLQTRLSYAQTTLRLGLKSQDTPWGPNYRIIRNIPLS